MLFSPIIWLNLRHSALKATKWRIKWGLRISKCGPFLPPPLLYVTWHDTCAVTVSDKGMWSSSVIHNSVTDNHRIIKIGIWIGHDQPCICKSVNVNGHVTWLHKTLNISRKRHRIVEINMSYRKSRSPERMAVQIFENCALALTSGYSNVIHDF